MDHSSTDHHSTRVAFPNLFIYVYDHFMPSLMHEGLIEMVRKRPAVVADFLTGLLGVKVPAFEKAQLSPNDLTEVTPTEFRADQVVALRKANDDAAFAVVVEVQLRVDERKRQTWPVYFATVHHRLKCPVALLVLCPSEAMAQWSADPIRVGDPGMVLSPIALGPKQVPVVTDLQTAREHPELAVLSALAHGNSDDPAPVFGAFAAALNKFDLDDAELYTRLVVTVLHEAAKACLEEIMTTAAEHHETDLGELLFPKAFARGKAEGKAEAVLAILAARGVEVHDEVRERIATCTDAEQLDTWVHRAVLATTFDDLFV